MTTWDDNSYWERADGLARSVHRQLLSQAFKRGTYFHETSHVAGLKYMKDLRDTSGSVEFSFKIQSDDRLILPDNFGFCLTTEEHCQIEIITCLPKYYRVSKLHQLLNYKKDLLNVIRHEIEHMFQTGAYELSCIDIVSYDRSPRNYMLDSYEVPAYVHGFRIASQNDLAFCKSACKFINDHGKALSLDEEEITYTKKVWLSYLKNLSKHHRMINV